MTASGRRTVIVWVAALGVAVMLVAAASAGPSGVVGDLGTDAPPAQSGQAEEPVDRPSPDSSEDGPPRRDAATDLGAWLQEVLGFALLLAGLWISVVVLRFVALRLTRELPEEQLVLDLDPLPDVEAGREAMRRGRDRLDATLAGSDVRNGIVACWVLLEETAARVGVTRRPAETATEFVVRFLHTLDVDPRPVAVLAALFHEARFSTHDLPADARLRAESALAGIHADLDRSPAT